MTPRIAYNERDAWAQIDELDRCRNCRHVIGRDLFGNICENPEGGSSFHVDDEDTCECFTAKDKKATYWINKLVEMAMEYSGENDFFRQLTYHEANGTADKFLSK